MRIVRGITRNVDGSDNEPPQRKFVCGLLTWFIVLSFIFWLGLHMCPHAELFR
jgi:hypothetical protein